MGGAQLDLTLRHSRGRMPLMPIEKILVRTLAVLSFVFFLIALRYYQFPQNIYPLIFVVTFIAADKVFTGPKQDKNKPSKISRLIITLLIVGAFVAFFSLIYLWTFAPFNHL